MKRSEFIRILKSGKRHKDPEITFWIDEDIVMDLEDAGEFGIMPEMTLSFKIRGRIWSKDSPRKVKKELWKKHELGLKPPKEIVLTDPPSKKKAKSVKRRKKN